VRRRAAAEGWGEERPAALRGLRSASPGHDPAAVIALLAGEPPDGEEEFDRDPNLEPFVAAHTHEVGQLLMRPAPERLSRFAFRRSAEAAARGAPSEAVVWMRLVQAIARSQDHLERAARPFAPADYMRARFAAELRAFAELEPDTDAHDHETIDGPPNSHRPFDDAAAAAEESARPDAR